MEQSINKIASNTKDFLKLCNGQNIIVLVKHKQNISFVVVYLISPDQNGKCFFVLQGLPNSGKSLLGKFLQELFPEYKIATLDIDQLSKRNATSQLMNKSLNISMDLPNKALSPPLRSETSS